MNPLDLRQLPDASEVYLCHDEGYFPVLINPQGEEILAVLRGGAGHVGITGRLDAVHSLDGGKTWEMPIVIVDTEVDDRNPAVGQAPDGTVVLAYHAQGSYNEDGSWARNVRRVQMRVTRSHDGGATWEPSQPLNYTHRWKNTRLMVASTHWMTERCSCPIYGSAIEETEQADDCAYILRSHDNGQTWGEPTLIAAGYNETGLILLSNGDLVAAMRSGDQRALLAVSRSADAGATWDRANPRH